MKIEITRSDVRRELVEDYSRRVATLWVADLDGRAIISSRDYAEHRDNFDAERLAMELKDMIREAVRDNELLFKADKTSEKVKLGDIATSPYTTIITFSYHAVEEER